MDMEMSRQGFILSPQSLLDKLLVVCPNADYCEEVLPRSDLQAHLNNRCHGTLSHCKKIKENLHIKGDQKILQNPTQNPLNKLPLPRADIVEGSVCTIDIQRGCYDLGLSVVGGADTPLGSIIIQEIFAESVAGKDGRLKPGDQLLEVNGISLVGVSHAEARQALKQLYAICRLTVYREKSDDQAAAEQAEELVEVSLQKQAGAQLGIKLVSKKCYSGLYILDVIEGSLADEDEYFYKDDRILEINGVDMREGTQEQAAEIIQAAGDEVHFLLSRFGRRDMSDDPLHASLHSSTSSPSTSSSCDMQPSTSSSSSSTTVISTHHRNHQHSKHHHPTSSRSTHHYHHHNHNPTIPESRQKIVTIVKDPADTLGISVAGGAGSARGDIPLYITNIQPHGSVGHNNHIKKGDVIISINSQSVLDLCHADAVTVLKVASQNRTVKLNIVDGPETSDGIANFSPSWRFWLSLPSACYPIRKVRIRRTSHGTLGFSIVGGSDGTHGCDPIYVKSVVPTSPAAKEAKLKSGDLLLSVNGLSLHHVTHCHAVRLLIGARDFVDIRLVTWPGTLV